MNYWTYIIRPGFLLLLLQPLAYAGPTDPIMQQGDSVITQQQFDAQMSKIPQRDRVAYLLDGERAKKTLQQLMMFQRIADDAKKMGFETDPNVQLRIQLAGVKELAEAYLNHKEEEKLSGADFELMAKEYYLVHKQEFNNPGSIDVAHILIGTANRSEAEARLLSNQLYSKLITDPTQWEKFVVEYSEDSASRGNGGKYLAVLRGKMVKPFEDAAFNLKNSGDISEPVLTQFGFHIIRLDAIHKTEYLPFESVKNKLISQQQQTYIKKARNDYISYINLSEPVIIPDCALDEMVDRYFKDDKHKAALEACLLDKSSEGK